MKKTIEFQVPAAVKPSICFRPRNDYACADPECNGRMDCQEPGRATCNQCGLTAGDSSQIVSSDGLDFISVLGKFRPASEVAEGMARMTAKPDPSSDPLALAMRASVEKRAQAQAADHEKVRTASARRIESLAARQVESDR